MHIKNLIKRYFAKLPTVFKSIFTRARETLKILPNRISVFVMRKWLFLWGWILRIFYKVRKPVSWILFSSFCLALVYMFVERYETFVDIQSQTIEGNLNISFSTFFTTIGAAVLGVLAITFSLSLFALQQAADKYTPKILSDFLKDRTNRVIFWTIALIAMLFFVFALFPLKNILLIELVLTFIFLLIIFGLLRKQYFHITKIINPNYQIISYHNRAIKNLNEIDRWLDIMIRIGAIRPGPDQRNARNENT